MATIFNLPLTLTSESTPNSFAVFLVWLLEFRCYIVQKLRYCVISSVLSVMAVIFNFPFTPISKSVHTSSAVLLDPENVGLASGILFLCCIEAEIMR